MSSHPPQGFPIRGREVERYLLLSQVLGIFLITVWIFGIGLLLALLHGITLGPWLTRRQREELRYWLDGSTLRADQGVFFRRQRAIPLDRITDLALVQGPLMRRCGIWGLQVQTSGTGHGAPEAILLGLEEPERVRDFLLERRDELVRERARS
jgi:putative membrane protein